MGGKIGKSRFWHMRALSSDDFCFYWFDEVQSKTQVHFVVCYAVISSVAYSAHSDVVFVWRFRNSCEVLMLSSFGQQPAWNGCIVSFGSLFQSGRYRTPYNDYHECAETCKEDSHGNSMDFVDDSCSLREDGFRIRWTTGCEEAATENKNVTFLDSVPNSL